MCCKIKRRQQELNSKETVQQNATNEKNKIEWNEIKRLASIKETATPCWQKRKTLTNS